MPLPLSKDCPLPNGRSQTPLNATSCGWLAESKSKRELEIGACWCGTSVPETPFGLSCKYAPVLKVQFVPIQQVCAYSLLKVYERTAVMWPNGLFESCFCTRTCSASERK